MMSSTSFYGWTLRTASRGCTRRSLSGLGRRAGASVVVYLPLRSPRPDDILVGWQEPHHTNADETEPQAEQAKPRGASPVLGYSHRPEGERDGERERYREDPHREVIAQDG